MIDSHAHICGEDLFPQWREAAAGAKSAGIKKIMIICRDGKEARRVISMADEDPMFDVAFGYSPNDVLKVGEREWEELGELVKAPSVKAVGSIGMDYFFYETIVPKVLQKEMFIRQMHMANELGKPAIIHMRMAAEDTRRYIKGHLKVPGIVHGYSGGYELMKDFLDIGMYLSFSGRVLMEASEENTRKVIREIPLDRLLVESNAVFGAPGTLGQAEHISSVIDYICTLRGMEKEALMKALHDNYGRLFGYGSPHDGSPR